MNALQLLDKYITNPLANEIIVEHGRQVADKSLQIAKRFPNMEVDLNFLSEAAFLHDIGVALTDTPSLGCNGVHPYLCHGILGRQILENEGLPRHALVCERHIGVGLRQEDIINQGLPLPARDMSPISLEEKIICFADLFYSKKPDKISHEKSIEAIRRSLQKHGKHQVGIFEEWCLFFSETG